MLIFYVHSVHTLSLYVGSQYNFAYKWQIWRFQCDSSMELQTVHLYRCFLNQSKTRKTNKQKPQNKQASHNIIILQYSIAIKSLYRKLKDIILPFLLSMHNLPASFWWFFPYPSVTHAIVVFLINFVLSDWFAPLWSLNTHRILRTSCFHCYFSNFHQEIALKTTFCFHTALIFFV